MEKTSKLGFKLLAVLLTLVTVIGIMPLSVFAKEVHTYVENTCEGQAVPEDASAATSRRFTTTTAT